MCHNKSLKMLVFFKHMVGTRSWEALCVKFHPQTRCSLVEICEKLSRKLENVVSIKLQKKKKKNHPHPPNTHIVNNISISFSN